MNRETKKFSHPPEKKEKKLKRERLPANPLRGFATRTSGSGSCSSNGSGGSGSTSSHRFLLSHSFSSSSSSSSTSSSMGVNPPHRPVKSVVAKTPKSAPVVVSKPLIRKKPKSLEETKVKPNATEKPQRCRTNPTFGKRVAGGKKPSVSREVKLKDTVRVVDDKVVTPVSKLGTGSDLVYRSNGGRVSNSNSSDQEKTPPVQASVSPEMLHCGTSMSLLSASAQSQACYAAGHLLSGVSDKRKCKPKGILTVCENGFEVGKGKILNDSDEFDEGGFGVGGSYDDNISMMPASVQWLLSPCDEEKEDEKEKYDDGFSELQEIVECVGHETPSPLSTSSDLCNISGGRSLSPMSICKETVRRTSYSLSPNELSRFRRFMQLSSPKCELDPSEHLGGDKQSPLSVDTLGSENVIQTPESSSSFDSYLRLLSSLTDIKLEVDSDLESLTATLQSTKLSPQKPSSSSFNFDSLATSSRSIDLSQFQRGRLVEGEAPAGKGRELLPCSAAESISTDGGGGLICSEDSNWMECYNKS